MIFLLYLTGKSVIKIGPKDRFSCNIYKEKEGKYYDRKSNPNDWFSCFFGLEQSLQEQLVVHAIFSLKPRGQKIGPKDIAGKSCCFEIEY